MERNNDKNSRLVPCGVNYSVVGMCTHVTATVLGKLLHLWATSDASGHLLVLEPKFNRAGIEQTHAYARTQKQCIEIYDRACRYRNESEWVAFAYIVMHSHCKANI